MRLSNIEKQHSTLLHGDGLIQDIVFNFKDSSDSIITNDV